MITRKKTQKVKGGQKIIGFVKHAAKSIQELAIN